MRELFLVLGVMIFIILTSNYDHPRDTAAELGFDAQKLIEECQAKLPRSQICELVAVPRTEDET